MNENINQFLEILQTSQKLVDSMISKSEMEVISETISLSIRDLKSKLENEIANTKSENTNRIKNIDSSLNQSESRLKEVINKIQIDNLNQIKGLSEKFTNEIKRVERNIPRMPHIPDNSLIELKINDLESKVLDAKEQRDIKNLTNLVEGQKQEIDLLRNELKSVPRGGALTVGGTRPVAVFNNGVQVAGAVTEINFVNATSISTNGLSMRRVNVTTGGGGSSGDQTPSGTVDGVNTIFTFATAPTSISVDGQSLRATSTDGTVNWTGTTTITLTIAPVFDIHGVSTAASGYQVPSGTVNGSNMIFTFTTAPVQIVVDGQAYRAVSSDGTINWIGTTIITLAFAPNYDIYGVA